MFIGRDFYSTSVLLFTQHQHFPLKLSITRCIIAITVKQHDIGLLLSRSVTGSRFVSEAFTWNVSEGPQAEKESKRIFIYFS